MPKWYGGSALNPDELIPPEEQWKLQWQRVIRWFQQSRKIKEKSKVSEPDAFDIDVLIAFFQNCYHLKDWIRTSRPDLAQKLEVFATKNFEIGACRDICNGYKHKTISKPSHDPDFNLYREYDPFTAEVDQSENPIFYRVTFAEGNDIRKYDLFDFAERCFSLWKSFISTELANTQKRKIERVNDQAV
jgi:hypothetical protein